MNRTINSSLTLLLSSTSKLHFRKWEPVEETTLMNAYKNIGPAWPIVSRQLPGRSPTQCRKHWLELEWKPKLSNISATAPVPTVSKKERSSVVSAKPKKPSTSLFVPRPSSLFPSPSPLPPMTPQQKAEWNLMWHGYEKVNGKWTLFPQDHLGLSPAQRLSADLPKVMNKQKLWTLDEDLVLREAFEAYGCNWEAIAYLLPNRSADDCRTRLVFKFMTLNPISEPSVPSITSVDGPHQTNR